MNLKELIAAFKAEWGKGDQASKEVLDDLISDMEPIAQRDYKTIKKLEAKAEGKSPEDVAALELKIEELTDQLGKVTRDSEKTIKALTKERDEVAAKVSETQKKARDFERSVVLREALAKQGIGKRAAEDVGDAIAYIERLVQYGEDGTAFVKGEDGKSIPLAEYAEKHYPSTPHAKRFIPDGNSGAGAGGNRGNVPDSGRQMKKADYEGLPSSDRKSLAGQVAAGQLQLVD